MGRRLWSSAPVVGAAAVLAVLVWRVGTGPFLDGVRGIDGLTLAAVFAIAVLTSVCCAWRWKIVARALGVDLPLGAAVAACYGSVFLNTVLPGGMVGDVHRGISHGRDVGDVGKALRAVVWERTAGQVVQGVLTVIVLLALPSPVRSSMPVIAVAVAVLAIGGAVLLTRARPLAWRSRWARTLHVVRADVRDGLLAWPTWPGVVLASAVVVAGHTATFVIAARTAGAALSLPRMLPIAVLVLAAMTLPNVAGWGPREGVAAWVFTAAGLDAAAGVTAAVAYGVMVFVAALPGAGVIAVASLSRRARRCRRVGAAHPAGARTGQA